MFCVEGEYMNVSRTNRISGRRCSRATAVILRILLVLELLGSVGFIWLDLQNVFVTVGQFMIFAAVYSYMVNLKYEKCQMMYFIISGAAVTVLHIAIKKDIIDAEDSFFFACVLAFVIVGGYIDVVNYYVDYIKILRLTQTVEAQIVNVIKLVEIDKSGPTAQETQVTAYYPVLQYEFDDIVYSNRSENYRRTPPVIGHKFKIFIDPNNPNEFQESKPKYSKGTMIRDMLIGIIIIAVGVIPVLIIAFNLR